jgi:hypothetical protein
MFLLELFLTSIGVLVVLIAGVGCIILSALAIITLCVQISNWSDDHGSWVEWVAMLVLLWLFAFALSVCLRY